MSKIGLANENGYNIILADPPWKYKSQKAGGSMTSGASQKYPTMTLDAVCGLPVRSVARRDSVVFLWATVPLLITHAPKVFAAWGLEYKTALFWIKPGLGLGYWFRGGVEVLLMGVYGNPTPFRTKIKNWFIAKKKKHSQKPARAMKIIENATANMPDAKRLELFASRKRHGWRCLGMAINQQDIRQELCAMADVLKAGLPA